MPESDERIDALSEQVSRLEQRLTMGNRIQLVLILALLAFVWRSALMQHRALQNAQTAVPRIHQDIAQQVAAVAELQKYGATHPDVARILRNHGIEPVPPAPTPAPQLPPSQPGR